jgi:hypothetical protein
MIAAAQDTSSGVSKIKFQNKNRTKGFVGYNFIKGKVILTQVPGYLFVERCEGL